MGMFRKKEVDLVQAVQILRGIPKNKDHYIPWPKGCSPGDSSVGYIVSPTGVKHVFMTDYVICLEYGLFDVKPAEEFEESFVLICDPVAEDAMEKE